MFRIGQFSRLSGLSVEALRHYDRMGVLSPSAVDAETGYRLYGAEQLAAAYEILALKDAGFTLCEIAEMRAEAMPPPKLVALLEAKALDMRHVVRQQQERLDRLLSSIFLIKNGGIPMMNEITIKAVQPIRVCTLRRCIDKAAFDAQLEEMWPAVNDRIQRQGIRRAVPCLMLYHDGTWDHSGDTLDIEVAEPITGEMTGKGEVNVYTLPAVERMACVVHRGPFSTIVSTYTALFDWLRQNGYETRGPLREIYHKGDWATEDPNEYVTELQVPI